MSRGRSGLEVTFLDVGQGDAIFISLPNGGNVFIDGGSTSSKNIYEKVSKKDKVDAIVVLDPHALEELGEQSDEDSYQGADIYGIGSSVKAVVLLDNGNIQGLVVPDAYEIGYKSVGEMAQRLEHRFYRLKGHKTEIKVFDRDEFSLNDNLERFLYSYE